MAILYSIQKGNYPKLEKYRRRYWQQQDYKDYITSGPGAGKRNLSGFIGTVNKYEGMTKEEYLKAKLIPESSDLLKQIIEKIENHKHDDQPIIISDEIENSPSINSSTLKIFQSNQNLEERNSEIQKFLDNLIREHNSKTEEWAEHIIGREIPDYIWKRMGKKWAMDPTSEV
uniref:Uncharacterized protein n=1 Tax=Strombidium inclinatum TaxID=197538 RepID=A0A7S3IY39_9SPIT|mmetsp:Transcript_4455/g.6594  ORF Transcript_4455/g.6594 Transcript_4455/m.6594 type:complete len:172 (+) Transcript_4455:1928-2443(+)